MRDPEVAPVGVRPVSGSPDGTSTRLRWVEPGQIALALGDRVVVRDADAEWLGEVVVTADRLVEWPDLDDLPVVSRREADDEWPRPAATDGGRLLESLGLSPEMLRPSGTSSATGTGAGSL